MTVLEQVRDYEETAEGCLAKQTRDYRAVLRGRFCFGRRVSIALASFFGGTLNLFALQDV